MEGSELLTWEECRKQIIELGKFEFISDGKVKTSSRVYMKAFEKNYLIKDSVFYLTKNFPKNINYNERIYYILLSKKEYMFFYCPECKNLLKFKSISAGYPIYCSIDCANKSEARTTKAKNTCMLNWGVTSPSKSPIIRDKQEKTTFLHYNVINPFQAEEVKETIRQVHMANLGVFNPMQSPLIIERHKESCMKSMGVDNCSKSPEIQNKKKQNCFELHGVYSLFNLESFQMLIKNIFISKYNVENAIHVPGAIEKRKNTCISRYNTKNPQLRYGVTYSKISQELFDALYKEIPNELQQECYYATCKTFEHSKEFVKYDYINDTGYYYDFVLSHLKIVIEFDGRYWHLKPETKKRDIQKQKFIENLGFKVVHIKEQDYYDDKEKVISFCVQEIMKKYYKDGELV